VSFQGGLSGVSTVELGTVALDGMESMSNAPYLTREMRQGRRHGDATLVDAMIYDSLWDVNYDAHMGHLTEEHVDRFDVPREAQDEYALRSHRRAGEAVALGHPIGASGGILTTTLAYRMRREDHDRGIVGMSVGGGGGIAALLER